MASRRNLLFSIQFLKVKIFEGNQHLAESCFHTPARRLSHFGDLCDRNRQLYKSLTRTRMSQFCGRRNDLHFNDNIRHAIGLSTNTSPVVQRPEVLSLSNHTVQPTSTIERSKPSGGWSPVSALRVKRPKKRPWLITRWHLADCNSIFNTCLCDEFITAGVCNYPAQNLYCALPIWNTPYCMGLLSVHNFYCIYCDNAQSKLRILSIMCFLDDLLVLPSIICRMTFSASLVTAIYCVYTIF